MRKNTPTQRGCHIFEEFWVSGSATHNSKIVLATNWIALKGIMQKCLQESQESPLAHVSALLGNALKLVTTHLFFSAANTGYLRTIARTSKEGFQYCYKTFSQTRDFDDRSR
jgi:hypothetical protein